MLVVNLEAFGIKETITFSDYDIIKWINTRDFADRLKFVSGIKLETKDIAEQLKIIAALSNKLKKENLTPDKKRALISFLENILFELKE